MPNVALVPYLLQDICEERHRGRSCLTSLTGLDPGEITQVCLSPWAVSRGSLISSVYRPSIRDKYCGW